LWPFDGHEVVPEHQVDRESTVNSSWSMRTFAQVHELVEVTLGHGAGARSFLEGIDGREAIATGHLESIT
jgi:hypothetical protein